MNIKQPKTQPQYNNLYKQWGFLIIEDYPFHASGGGVHTVPAGFWYNAGSIPAPFWQLTYSPYDPVLLAPTLVHDWPYLSHCVPKEVADQTLYDYAMALGASSFKMTLIRRAVVTFGDRFYQRDDVDMAYLSGLRTDIIDSGRSLARYGLE